MTDNNQSRASIFKTIILCFAILLVASAFVMIIFSTEPEPKTETATKRSPMLVEVYPVEIGQYTPKLSLMGQVIPSTAINLTSQVTGKLTKLSEHFVPGHIVKEGQFIAQIEKADYLNQYHLSKNQLTRANAALQIELGEQDVAKKVYDDLEQTLPDSSRALMLREPQLKQAKASVKEAQILVKQAQLQLDRTTITAPFDALIQRKQIDLGSHVNSGTVLAQLVGINEYWIEANVPTDKLSALSLASSEDKPITMIDNLAWPEGATRSGVLLSILPAVDSTSRMARVLVSVKDPLSLQQPALAKMTLGAYVSLEIPTAELEQVAKISRALVRKNNTVWLMEDGKLAIRPLNIVFKDKEHVYVKGSLSTGDKIVITDLSRVKEGTSLRTAEQVTYDQ